MNKCLIFLSLFSFSFCSANQDTTAEIIAPDQIVVSSTELETTPAQAEDVSQVVETTETLVDQEIENTSLFTEDSENIVAEEFVPTALVFDFVMELETATEDWVSLINSAKTFYSRYSNSQEKNIQESLRLAQTIYNHAISEENTAHGSLCASLYESDNATIGNAIECASENYVSIRLAIVRNNQINPELWEKLQHIVQSVQTILQASQTTSEQVAQDVQIAQDEIQTAEAIQQQDPIVTITTAIQTLFSLAESDNTNSVSTFLHVNTAMNNQAE